MELKPLKHHIVMPKPIQAALNHFLATHVQLQLDLYNYSAAADRLGYNGFCHWLQVQAQDEVLHQRKIMNYLFQREALVEINTINISTSADIKMVKDIDTIVHLLHEAKAKFLIKTHEIVKMAQAENDAATSHFMDWFIEDFVEEIDELKVLHDQLAIANGDHYRWDRHQGKRTEPDTLRVIVPFYEPA